MALSEGTTVITIGERAETASESGAMMAEVDDCGWEVPTSGYTSDTPESAW